MSDWISTLRGFVVLGAQNSSYYLVPATTVFLCVWAMRRYRSGRNAIRKLTPPRGQMYREAFNSVRSSFIFGAMFVGVSVLLYKIFPQHYVDYKAIFDGLKRDYGFGVYALSIPLILIGYDGYFYWTHRLMHHPTLFRVFHSEHHRSHNPTAWSAQSFSVLEATVNGAFLPLYVFLVPSDPVTATMFLILSVTYSAVVHSGMEFFPRWMVDHPVCGWVNGTTHHDMHHGLSRSNYGLFFRLWDRAMGTEDPDFLAAHRLVTTSAQASDTYATLRATSALPPG
jgi:lathosterol oxidase